MKKKHLGRFFSIWRRNQTSKTNLLLSTGNFDSYSASFKIFFLSPKKVIEPEFPKKGYPPGAKRLLAHIFHSIDYQGHWRTALKLHKVVLQVTCKLLVLFFISRPKCFWKEKILNEGLTFQWKKICFFCVIELEKQQKTIYKGPDCFWHLLC